jgi:small subunit ribosomal protein S9
MVPPRSPSTTETRERNPLATHLPLDTLPKWSPDDPYRGRDPDTLLFREAALIGIEAARAAAGQPRPNPNQSRTRVLATGRRKTAVARVFLERSASTFQTAIKINGKLLPEFAVRDSDRVEVMKPFAATGTVGRFNVAATVKGGGSTGQIGAVRLGIARALELTNHDYRAPLKAEGLLTRDDRMVERKKVGRHKARKGFQWVKR